MLCVVWGRRCGVVEGNKDLSLHNRRSIQSDSTAHLVCDFAWVWIFLVVVVVAVAAVVVVVVVVSRSLPVGIDW